MWIRPSQLMPNKMLRDGENEGGRGGNPSGNQQQQQQPNPGGDPGNDPNNAGQDAESLTEFWNSPAAGTGLGNPDPNPQAPTPPGDSGGDSGTLSAFETTMNGLTFGEVMNADIAQQMNDGDFTGLNAGLQKSMQSVAQQTLMMTAKMMNAFETRMADQMKTVSSNQVSMREAKTLLREAIPSAATPEFAPIIEGVFAQALTHSKGDNAKAIEMTKQFLGKMTTMNASEFGMNVIPPGDPNFRGNGANAGDSAGDMPTDWANEIFSHLATDN